MSGTPEGFTWAYDMFVSEPRPDTEVFYGDMRLNRYVAEEYAQMLADSYDDIMRQQYIEGKFLNVNAGTALYKFNRAKHAVRDDIRRQSGLPVWVSVDFNVAPLAATLWNRYPDGAKDGIKLRGFDEICISGGDTWELAKAIKEKAGDASEIVLFPDPAGASRKTSAPDNITDIEILEGAGFEDIRYHTVTSVRGSLLAANAQLGKNVIELDRKRCKETIKDFEQVTLKPGTNVLDKKNIARASNVSDKAYGVVYLFHPGLRGMKDPCDLHTQRSGTV